MMSTTELAAPAPALAAPAPRAVGLSLDRWRVPFTLAVLCVLPFVLPSQALAVNVLIYGLFTVGFNLLFGYTGLLSFGHAAFFGAGAYLTGMSIVHFGFGWLGAMLTGVVGASLLSAVIGALSIRTRGIYFCMVTLALAQLVYYLALQASGWTGGENGLRGFTVARAELIGGLSVNLLDPLQKYYFLMVFAALALWFVSRVLNSPFGAAIEAVRENETRARACGFDVERTKLLAFVLSGGVCGLAGTLSALHLSIVPLDALSVHTSSIVVMMTMLGGAGSFFGPFVGALVFLLIEDVASLWTSHWQLIVGIVFIAFVLFMPKGIWGSLIALARREGRAPR
jgi:branched-chain amino acid transport system permease protein